MSEKMVRMSFTVPPSVRSDLAYLAQRTGITKSALLTQFIETPLRDLRTFVELLPDNPTQDDLLRARGQSNEIITARLRSLRDQLDGASS